MVSNYDRIFAEITKQAELVAPELEIEPEVLIELVMEIVDLEDRHRTRNLRINQLVEERITTVATSQLHKEA